MHFQFVIGGGEFLDLLDSPMLDCNPGNAFSFLLFAVIFTAEQLSSFDDIWQVIGRVNLV